MEEQNLALGQIPLYCVASYNTIFHVDRSITSGSIPLLRISSVSSDHLTLVNTKRTSKRVRTYAAHNPIEKTVLWNLLWCRSPDKVSRNLLNWVKLNVIIRRRSGWFLTDKHAIVNEYTDFWLPACWFGPLFALHILPRHFAYDLGWHKDPQIPGLCCTAVWTKSPVVSMFLQKIFSFY